MSRPSNQYAVDAQMAIEAQLVADAQHGNRDAFAALVDLHGDRLYGFMVQMAGGDHELAGELSQEALVRAWEKLRLFNGGSRFYTWLYRLARNRALDIMAKRRPRPMDTELLEATAPPQIDRLDRLEREELRRAVRAGLARLEPEQREIILMRDFEGLDYERIAELLEVAIGTVKSRLNRARSALRRQLNHLSEEDL